MLFVIKKSDVVTTQENGVSRFHEYQFPFKNASLGVSEINGRYPQTGYDVDEEIEQSWYVEEGAGIMWVNGQEYTIEKGDMVHIPEGEKYWIKGENLRLVVCSSKPWFPEQHKHIEG